MGDRFATTVRLVRAAGAVRSKATLLVWTAALALALSLGPLSTAASAASITVTPDSGPPGSSVLVLASGFPSGYWIYFCDPVGCHFQFHPNFVTVTFAGFVVGAATGGSVAVGFVVPNLAPGTYSVAARDSVSSTVVSTSFTVTKADQTISFAPLANKAFGDPPFTVQATASSGLPVSFSASGACTIAGASVTIIGPGSCAITASQAGNASYNAAPPVTQRFTITCLAAELVGGDGRHDRDGQCGDVALDRAGERG